jgi:NAD(P)-dependent dehydrogenase (short-subunit alcohol dehydrogenase family)
MARKLKDSVVVVTGASSGVGRAAARQFAQRGATVVAAARRQRPLVELADECQGLDGEVVAHPCDVTDPESVDELARFTAERFGKLDVWVNNAAVTMFARLEEAPLADIRAVIDTDVMGYVHGIRAAVPWMREQGKGVIINVGSVLSNLPAPYLAPYVVGKAASRALSACLRTELALDAPAITSCTVMPGPIDTPFFQHAANYTGRKIKPLRPTYDPERVARAIVSCARRPRRDVYVGFLARLDTLAYHLAPGITERIAARQVDRAHFADEWAPPTDGNLHAPMVAGDEPSGGWGHSSSKKPLAGAAAVATGVAAAATAAVVARGRRAA